MSLHKFAEQVAANGRGDDSLLVHMTPDEVQRLQAFAEANGTTMTINPETGLPEAGFLSDLFKAVAPIALGAFLGPAGAAIGGGMMSAGMAGLAVGGITTLATGSLSRGLMAGLGAYGGAGLGASLMGGGTAAIGSAAEGIQGPIGSPESGFGATQAIAAAPKADILSAGAKAAMADPMAFAKQNLGNIGYAAAPIMAGAMVPTTTKAPTSSNENYIRQFDFNINPDTGKPDPLYGVRSMAPVKANEWKDKTFQGQRDVFRQQNPNPYELGVGSLNQPPQQPTQMNTGGIVALAGGGDAALAAYQAGNYGEASRLLADAGMNAQDVVSKYGLSQADAATVAQNLGYKGDMGGVQYAPPAAPTYTQYTPEQMGSFLSNPVNKDIDIAAATKATNADPAAVNKYIAGLTTPFVGSTDTTGGSGTLGIYNNLVAQGVDPTEYYNAAIANDPKYAGWSKEDIQRGYNLDKGALALAAAQPGGVSDKNWAKFMDDNKYSVNDMAQAFGLSKNEVQRRYDAAKAIEKKVVTPITPITTVTGTGINTGINTGVNPDGYYGSGPATGVDYKGNTVSIATPGDIITNPDGTRTVAPNIPGRQPGGFTGIEELKSRYTAGGGSLGYTPYVPKTAAEHEAMFNKQTGDSLAAYNYLMGKGANPIKSSVSKLAVPYSEYALGKKTSGLKPLTTTTIKGTPGQPETYFDEKAYLAANPDVATEIKTGKSDFQSAYEHWLRYGQKEGRAFTGDYAGFSAAQADKAKIGDTTPQGVAKEGGLMGYADGGYAVGGGLGSLGSYSDGGRLLKGPGDGVSDSIPATIGAKGQPARLADGEFVIPARIVSELGNGSTDAGAKKLYAMMDRVQRARGKTTGKTKVAANSRSDKYLPA